MTDLYRHELVLFDKGDPGPNEEAQEWLLNSKLWARTGAKLQKCLEESEDPLAEMRTWGLRSAINPWARGLGMMSEWKVAPLREMLHPELEDRTTWKLAGFSWKWRPMGYLRDAWRQKYGASVLLDNTPQKKKDIHTSQFISNHKHRILMQTPLATDIPLFVTKHVVMIQPVLDPEHNAAAIARCGDGKEVTSVRWIAMRGTLDETYVRINMAQTLKALDKIFEC